MACSAADQELEDRFERAARYLQSIAGSVDPPRLLQLYGLYKQATCGACATPQPSWFSLAARRKWEAWRDLGETPRAEAMRRYVELLTLLDPDWEESSFSGWVSVSCPLPEPEEALEDSNKSLLDWAKEGGVERVRELAASQDVNQWDSEGMTALHWASDRGHAEVVRCLLSLGAQVDCTDSEGQTPLHYAACCGHAAVVALLLGGGASREARDREGDTPGDVASSPEIARLLNN